MVIIYTVKTKKCILLLAILGLAVLIIKLLQSPSPT